MLGQCLSLQAIHMFTETVLHGQKVFVLEKMTASFTLTKLFSMECLRFVAVVKSMEQVFGATYQTVA